MIYADGRGGFLASALASFPALLRRALVRVRAQRAAEDSFSLGATSERNRSGDGVSKATTSAGAGASEMTTTSGGGKRVRSAGRSSRKTTTGRRGEDEDDSAATRADVGEEALKAVAMMDVNASLGAALDLASDRTDLAKETARGSKRRRRSVRLSQGASPAGTHSSVGVTQPPRRAYGAEGGAAAPPIHRMLDVLVQRQEASDNNACPDDDDVPFLTGVLLRTAADVAAGDDVLRWALRAAGELAASEENGEGDGEGDAREGDGKGREIAVADSGGEIFPSKSGASSHRHVDLALGGAGVDDDGVRAPTPSEKARQRPDRRERTRTALAPGKKTASISRRVGRLGADASSRRRTAAAAAAAGEGTQRVRGGRRSRRGWNGGGGCCEECPSCDIDLAPIPGMKHCYGCGGPL